MSGSSQGGEEGLRLVTALCIPKARRLPCVPIQPVRSSSEPSHLLQRGVEQCGTALERQSNGGLPASLCLAPAWGSSCFLPLAVCMI